MKNYREWSHRSLTVVIGCEKVTGGECAFCYSEDFSDWMARMATKMEANGKNPGGRAKYRDVVTDAGRWNGRVVLIPEAIDEPLSWRKPARVFVASMSDIFHPDVPDDFIHRVFEMMVKASSMKFIILTKRSERLRALSPRLPWPTNVAAGVSVGIASALPRIDDLRATGAHIKFISAEPLIQPLPGIDLGGIDWCCVGGESGDYARPMHPDWARAIRDQAVARNIPFIFKGFQGWLPEDHAEERSESWKRGRQVRTFADGTRTFFFGNRSGGCLLDGREWTQFPVGWDDAALGREVARAAA